MSDVVAAADGDGQTATIYDLQPDPTAKVNVRRLPARSAAARHARREEKSLGRRSWSWIRADSAAGIIDRIVG